MHLPQSSLFAQLVLHGNILWFPEESPMIAVKKTGIQVGVACRTRARGLHGVDVTGSLTKFPF